MGPNQLQRSSVNVILSSQCAQTLLENKITWTTREILFVNPPADKWCVYVHSRSQITAVTGNMRTHVSDQTLFWKLAHLFSQIFSCGNDWLRLRGGLWPRNRLPPGQIGVLVYVTWTNGESRLSPCYVSAREQSERVYRRKRINKTQICCDLCMTKIFTFWWWKSCRCCWRVEEELEEGWVQGDLEQHHFRTDHNCTTKTE